MNASVYKLNIFKTAPSDFDGKLYSFLPSISNAEWIDLSDDPFKAIKLAVITSIGSPVGLIVEGEDFYSELFSSLYEQLSFIYLETKHLFIPQIQAFFGKKKNLIGTLTFENQEEQKILFIGSCASLEKSVHVLQEASKYYTIAACYSALPFLEKHGIIADLCFAIDPMQKRHPSKNAKLLLIAPKAEAGIIEGFNEVAYFPETFCHFSNFLFKHHPHPPVYGYTVADTAIKFLIQHGFKSIGLMGLSLEEEGAYPGGQITGYKPDYKKAKLHLDQLRERIEGIYYFDQRPFSSLAKTPLVYTQKCLSSSEKIGELQESLKRLFQLDFGSLGLVEMLLLEEEPFFQVVMEPLCQKWMLFQDPESKGVDKRNFYNQLIEAYRTLLQAS